MTNNFIQNDIADTAFITNYYRSQDENLSGDPWAKLWVIDKAKELGDAFTDEVVPHDPINIHLRYRYFFKALKKFKSQFKEFCFINIGSGFTTYPYHDFMRDEVLTIEIDQTSVVNFKEQSSLDFQNKNLLPVNKKIHYLGLNFETDNFKEKIHENLSHLNAQNVPQFILMEGFFYYLSRDVFKALWDYLIEQMAPGSQIGVIYMPTKMKDTSVMEKIDNFYLSNVGIKKII